MRGAAGEMSAYTLAKLLVLLEAFVVRVVPGWGVIMLRLICAPAQPFVLKCSNRYPSISLLAPCRSS